MASLNAVDSLYLDYVHERGGFSALVTDDGFLTYKIENGECFLSDLVVRKEKRRTGAFAALMRKLEAIARAEGCNVITSNIHLNDPGANHTIRAGFGIGFKIISSGVGVLLMAKDLRGV